MQQGRYENWWCSDAHVCKLLPPRNQGIVTLLSFCPISAQCKTCMNACRSLHSLNSCNIAVRRLYNLFFKATFSRRCALRRLFLFCLG